MEREERSKQILSLLRHIFVPTLTLNRAKMREISQNVLSDHEPKCLMPLHLAVLINLLYKKLARGT